MWNICSRRLRIREAGMRAGREKDRRDLVQEKAAATVAVTICEHNEYTGKNNRSNTLNRAYIRMAAYIGSDIY